MLGRVGQLFQVTLDPRSRLGANVLYREPLSQQYHDGQEQQQNASPDTWGRGRLSSSNKPADTNIRNMPVFYVAWQSARQLNSRQTGRTLSKNAPPPAGVGRLPGT